MAELQIENQMIELLRDRDELQTDLRTLNAKISSINKVLNGYAELYPGIEERVRARWKEESDSSADQLKGQRAILQIMEAPHFANTYWTIPAMRREMEIRGTLPDSDRPSNVIRAALLRLVHSDPRVVRGIGANGNQVFFLKRSDAPPPHFEGGEINAKVTG